jgi:hypothetical protein
MYFSGMKCRYENSIRHDKGNEANETKLGYILLERSNERIIECVQGRDKESKS